MKYMNNHFGKNRIPMNLQIFAESGESEGGENGETDGEGGTGGDKPTYEQLVEELAKARTEASQANADKERFKNSVDRLTRQNGELTNQVRERMSADEKAAAEKAEAEAAKDARIQELESKFRLMDYSKRFMGVGMDETSATELAGLSAAVSVSCFDAWIAFNKSFHGIFSGFFDCCFYKFIQCRKELIWFCNLSGQSCQFRS